MPYVSPNIGIRSEWGYSGSIRPCLANELRNKLHGTRTVQGIHGYDILKHRRFQILQHPPDARGFELKYARGIAAPQHLIRQMIVIRHLFEIECSARQFLNPSQRTLNDGQRPQTQKSILSRPTLSRFSMEYCVSGVFSAFLAAEPRPSADRGK